LTMGHAEPVADQQNSLLPLIRDDTVAVFDGYFVGFWPQLLGAPGPRPSATVGVGVTPLMLTSSYTTATGPLPGGHGANRAANRQARQFMAAGQSALSEAMVSLGTTQELPNYLDAAALLPDMFAQLSVEDFEFERGDAPSGLQLVGWLRHTPGSVPLPDWWDELDHARPLVVVTQGTLANSDYGRLIIPTAEALADLDVNVVAALGRKTTLDTVHPANFRSAAMLPFDQVFEQASVFVTNGGYGGTQQALLAGTPVVIAGTTEDKPAVAARIVARGLGVDLASDRPTSVDLRNAVQTILGDDGYQQRAQRFADKYRGVDAASAIAQIVARLS
jgi:UDP:flavonoid glycosyltransferase YjiC (YdhE family)